MKQTFLILVVAALSVVASAQLTTTPNLGLELPPHNYKQWDIPMNFNSTVIDQLFAFGSCGVGDPTKTLFYNATVKQFGCQTVSGGGGSSAFGAITAGTNVAALLMGTGGSLGVTGAGTIYATTLLGSTWASPAAIGSGTPSTGVFTNLSSSSFTSTTGIFTNLTVTGICTGCGGGGGSPPFSVITAGTNTSALLVGSGGSFGVTGGGTIDSTTLLGGTWAVPGTIGSTTPNSGAFTSLNSTTTGTFNNLTVTGVCTGCAGSTTAFGSITSGTSTGTLLVGSGGSLAPTGSGTITASSFLGLTAGTSGGVPYFSSGSTLASSAALTANLPVIGGGAGVAPSVGSRTGNTTQFASWTGATTASRCIDTDASGNLRITASDCNVGTVTSVGETFTGGIVSVAGSPITSSGTLAFTVAGVSGGIPYFSSGASWASSALMTANALIKGGGVAAAPASSAVTESAGVLATNADRVSIAPSATAAGGALNVAPAPGNTGTPSAVFNNPSGSTVDILDINLNGVTQDFADLNGTWFMQTTNVNVPNAVIAPEAIPSTLYTGAFGIAGSNWWLSPDGVATILLPGLSLANAFTAHQAITNDAAGSPVLKLTAAPSQSADSFQLFDSTPTKQVWVDIQTLNATPTWTLHAGAFQATSNWNGQTVLSAKNVVPPPLAATNAFAWEAPATISTSVHALTPLAGPPTLAGSVMTFDGTACTTDANGAKICQGTWSVPAGGGGPFPQTVSGTVTSGGIPYFSSTTQESSSALLPTGDFVLGGGAGGAPTATFSVVPVANGGTALASGTSGGILGYTATGTLASSALLPTGDFVLGGGAGATPTATFSVVPVANGGTALATLTAHALYVGNATSAPNAVAVGATGTLLAGATGADPSFTASPNVTAISTGTAPTCTAGTGGVLCQGEGTAPTAAAAVSQLYTDSGLHDMAIQTNGGGSGIVNHTAAGAIHQTAQTAAISTATLCASTAGACNQAGHYKVSFDFIETGTACSNVTAGSVTFLLTWTDSNATAHSALVIPMNNQTGATSVAAGNSFTFATSLANAGASGSFDISTNGSVIQYATGYTACTTGTGTYQLDASVTRLQ